MKKLKRCFRISSCLKSNITVGLCRSGMADKAAFCNIPRSITGNDQQNSVELPVPPVSFSK
ncbi:hypothetical protein E1B42_04000 [Salmonella enterica subsp. enterica serovar Agona]|uniref:Uncharacterized protein n=2 Tax=Salmonella enterica I TaxID=59201 RepID=A0A4U7S140_SALET|nr:hypothetical protein [Salmonella enterica]EBC9959403.1 hypothetical protein [Salmonella enterica subsp. enterica serovar Agona]ECD2768213.1 hypothetical protein [Salmonella enterica subsp. enterica serovar Anecho]ECD6613622.1 hypothetical protein [Salmonella enterica subsp. enterica serovar Kentucky]EAM2276886.1 hypothetical protein [Salmonella enterica]